MHQVILNLSEKEELALTKQTAKFINEYIKSKIDIVKSVASMIDEEIEIVKEVVTKIKNGNLDVKVEKCFSTEPLNELKDILKSKC
ncbi:hypothetical protein [Arcobacter sp. CECT 8985]|uniref:hypothetical protein n=1 Tax=Arcobacter sp. CECT 8985 TaxID=1935424 RepID=UPI00100B3F60|nr:hypothetical protein [Arcobacter sp. CECT 8985]RXJ87887.1 hypothetical protein CRU93_01750 [Arcobacter sp. CECT 8985]